MNDEDIKLDKNDYRELSKWDAVLNPDMLPETDASGQAHPTPEQLFIREAIDKALMNRQRKIWEMYAYDQMTFAEMGRKLGISESAVRQRIKTIEKNLREWCEQHMETYKLLKEAERGS